MLGEEDSDEEEKDNGKSKEEEGRISIRNSESRNYPPFFCASRKERAILTQNPRKNRKNFRRMTSQSALEVPKVPFLSVSGIFDPDFKYRHLIRQNDRLSEL